MSEDTGGASSLTERNIVKFTLARKTPILLQDRKSSPGGSYCDPR